MLVDCVLYSDGKREPVGMAEAIQKARRVPGSFVWLELRAPTFDEFDDLALTGRSHNVPAQVTTLGKRFANAGEEVLQAFRRVRLQPGEERVVTLGLDARAFAHWDDAAQAWTVTPGQHRVEVGDSSDHLPLAETSDVPS